MSILFILVEGIDVLPKAVEYLLTCGWLAACGRPGHSVAPSSGLHFGYPSPMWHAHGTECEEREIFR